MSIIALSLGTGRKPHDRIFNASTAFMSDLYISNLSIFDSGIIRKIFISVIDTQGIICMSDYIFKNPVQLIDVIKVEVALNLQQYKRLNDIEKSKLQLKLIHSACLFLCKLMSWHESQFEIAYKECLKSNLSNSWVMNIGKRFFLSPNRHLISCLVCEWTINKFLVTATIFSRHDSYYKCVDILNNDSSMNEHFKKVFWIDNNTFRIVGMQKEKIWDVIV